MTMMSRSYLTRVYPSGFRLDSTNFNPQDMWNYGVQIASLNYQTPGLMMDINDGRFSMNGGCGFVLKPSIMRDKLAYFNPQGVQPGLVGKSLHLRIISGQNFPKPRGGGAKGHVIDPYVLIELFGVSGDCGEERTRTAPNNSGASPLFDESFEFRLGVPALALVRFVVLDDDFIGDEFIGQYTIPFECLQPGYRHVYLRSIFDEPLDDATLFIHVAISDAETSPFAIATPSSASSTPQARTPPPQAQSKRQVSAPPKRARKQRSRKELHQQLHLRHVGLQPLDGTFAPLSSHLHELAVLRDAQRTSMALFREVCGQPSLASIKQCVRAIRLRSLADVAAETARPAHPRRKFSSATDLDAGADASSGQRGGSRGTLKRAASADYTGTTCAQGAGGTRRQMSESTTMAADVVQVARGSGGLQLELRGCCAVSESWRRTQLAFERMVGDLTRTVDSTTRLLDVLLAAHRRAHQLYEDFTPYFSGDGAETPPRLQGGDSNGDVKYNKQSKAKKKPSSVPGGDVEIERRRRLVAEENVRWNCSVVRGAADMTRALERDARQALNDVWDGAVLCDISSHQASRVGTNPTTIVESVAENNANNNNDSATVEGRGQVSSRRGSTSSGSSCGLTTAPTNPDHLASLPTTTL